ncbi:hypothetical protein I8H84_01405 [Candidatus Saccharibacteria bacterium]|nr:hypothetical protein [Candidatus Saccharibacteria bacterium]MBH1972603.1 hypothetical protein [Candidatus Saccharibacteria bacterium]MBH1990805.1 hypothetical protein [Candidatus Saccharibacteria bacterium]
MEHNNPNPDDLSLAASRLLILGAGIIVALLYCKALDAISRFAPGLSAAITGSLVVIVLVGILYRLLRRPARSEDSHDPALQAKFLSIVERTEEP